MNCPFPAWVGYRYTRARQRNRFISLISLISMVGLILGVATLITVLSVMNGFDQELRERILGILPQGSIASTVPIEDWKAMTEEFNRNPEVIASAPYIAGSALVMAGDEIEGVAFSGVDPVLESQVSIIGNFFEEGSLAALNANEFGIVMGVPLAHKLGLSLGDKVTLVLPQASVSLVGALARVKRFTLVGTFKAGADVDRNLVYMSLGDAARMVRFGSGVQGIRLLFKDLFRAPLVLEQLLTGMDRGKFYGRSWMRQQGNIYQAIRMQKSTMYLLLMLVVAVAAFNIVSSLVMMVNDRKGEIAILRTLGASRYAIMGIFIAYGSIIGLIGVSCGALLGTGLAVSISDLYLWAERLFHLNLMNEYFINYLPSEVLIGDLVTVCSMTLLICLMATIYPAFRAANTDPADALRYE